MCQRFTHPHISSKFSFMFQLGRGLIFQSGFRLQHEKMQKMPTQNDALMHTSIWMAACILHLCLLLLRDQFSILI